MTQQTEPGLPGSIQSMTKNTFWLVFAKTIAFTISFALPLLLVRELTQTEFGLYRQVFLIINTAMAVLPLGFPLSAFYFFQKEPAKKGAVVYNILLFNLFVGGLAFLTLLLWPSALSVIFKGSDLLEYTPWISVVILLWVASSFLEIVTVANGETRLTTIWIVIGQLSRLVLLMAAAIFFGSVRALILAAAIHGILQTVILLVYLRSRFPAFWREFDGRLLRSQWAYVLPLGVAGLLYSVQMELHNYFVSNRFGPAVYAVYSVGCFQLPFLAIISESVGWVLIPAVSGLRTGNKIREIVVLIAKMMCRVAAVYFPVYLFLLITGREFIVLLFTTRYLESWPIFAIFLTLIPLGIISSAYDPVFRAYPEHLRFVLKTRFALVFPLVIGLWFGVKHFGLVGAVTAMVAVNLLERLIFAFKVGSLLSVGWKDLVLLKDMGKIALAAMVAALITVFTHQLMSGASPFAVLAGCGIVFGLVYLTVLGFLGVLVGDMLQIIWKVIMLPWGAFRKTGSSLVTRDR
jgi:O-antigen/teichoic acid export membrane protein